MSEPVVASRMPCVVEVEKGRTYFWCACGRSKTQPWCDGSHQGTGLAPVQFTARSSERVWLCACKHTKRAPLCDGSHNKLPPEGA
jgi:CDGSH iron-sulfur domain-containing protein 3